MENVTSPKKRLYNDFTSKLASSPQNSKMENWKISRPRKTDMQMKISRIAKLVKPFESNKHSTQVEDTLRKAFSQTLEHIKSTSPQKLGIQIIYSSKI
jgi:hypothetical protein